jgi:hypothetical protein
LEIPLKVDLLTISRNRQIQIDNRLLRSNARRVPHEYKVGDKVYIKASLIGRGKALPLCDIGSRGM